MLKPAELLTLRREAQAALTRLQALPGFSERFAELPRLPAEQAHWPWRAVLFVAEGYAPGTVRASWEPIEEVRRGDPAWVEAAEQVPGSVREDAGGALVVRTYSGEPRPTDPDLLREIDAYRDAVDLFARDFGFGAQWSARAVHDARRLGREILLPPAPARPSVALQQDIRFEATAGEPIDPAVIEAARQVIETGELHAAGLRLDAEKAALADAAHRLLAEEGSPEHAELAESLRKDARLRSPPEAAYDEKLSPKGRDARWEGALDAVAHRLREEPIPKRLRDHYSRVKDTLNAAVNGTFRASIPHEPTDDPGYFLQRRRLRQDSARALVEADRLSGGILSRTEPSAGR